MATESCEHCGSPIHVSLGQRALNYIAKLPLTVPLSLLSVFLGGDGRVSDPNPLVVRCPICGQETRA